MPPKKNPNKKKKELENKRKKMKERNDKILKNLTAAQKQAEDNLKKFRRMELQIEMDKKKKDNKKFNDLKVASTIASALNKKDKDDDDFAADAIALLQGLEPQKEEVEEEGISIGKLKSALRTAKAKKDKKKKNLLMKGKLKVWGDTPPNGLKLDSLLRRHTRGGRRTRKKRGGDKNFDKYKKITKDFLEHPEVAKKIKKHKKNKLSINQIMKKITRDKLNKIIKAYARYLKSQKGGKDPKDLKSLDNIEINRPTLPVGTVLRPELGQPPQGEQIDFDTIVNAMTRIMAAQEREQADQRQQRNQQRRENRFNMVHSLLFSMFMLLTVFGLMRDTNNVDLENTPVMNVLGQGIIMAHQTGLLGTARNIMLWDTYWSFFNNAWIPGGFTGEDLIVQRQLARFIAPFFPLPELRDDDDIPMPWEGGGSRPNSPAVDEADRLSPPDPWLQTQLDYQNRDRTFRRYIVYRLWANKKRRLYKLVLKKSGTRDEKVVSALMKAEAEKAFSGLFQNDYLNQLLQHSGQDFDNSLQMYSEDEIQINHRLFFRRYFGKNNINYIINVLDSFSPREIHQFTHVLEFLIGFVSVMRGKQMNISSKLKGLQKGIANSNVDPIDSFVLLCMIISHLRVLFVLNRAPVPQHYDAFCNTIEQIYINDIANVRNFKGWEWIQQGGKNKTRKRKNKRKNRKKTRK